MSKSKLNPNDFSDMIDMDLISNSTSKMDMRTKNQTQTLTQLVDTRTWVFNNYNITLSFSSDDNIFMNIINTITYQNYEGVIRDSDISSNLSLELFNTLINKSFSNQPNYKVIFQVENNFLKMSFTAVLDGFFPIVQTIELREKILSGDKALTIKLTEMESKFKKEINELNKQIEDLKNEPICFAHHPAKFGEYFKYSKNTTEFDFIKADGWVWLGNYIDFNKLTSLSKIIIYDKDFAYHKKVKDIWSPNKGGVPDYFTQDANGWQFYENYLLNIFDSPQIYLPSVIELEVKFSSNARVSNDMLRSLPNLKKITWNNFANNQLVSFALIKNIPSIKHLIYITCLNIHELDQIKNWCESKGIRLEIK
jgi:hypothetical protein